MLISLNGVTFSYTGEKIFSDVSLSIDEGERVGFIGGNGEGKTTLIKLILGELIPEEGSVLKKSDASKSGSCTPTPKRARRLPKRLCE